MTKRTRLKTRALCSAVSLLALTIAGAANAQENETAFDIDAQPLAKALLEFNEQSGVIVMAPQDLVNGKTAPAIKGDMAPEDALERLLSGSGLKSSETASGAYSITPASDAAALGRDASIRLAQADNQDARDVDTSRRPRDEEARPEEIIVTGTNIRGVAPIGAPLLQYDRQAIEQTGRTTLQEFFETVPQNFGGGVGDDSLNDATGGTFDRSAGAGLNLRGLGNSSTLVLLNGNRLAAANAGFVDVSMIPISAVERIDVLPDGASAIYGSDAISGVINVVLRDDFEGAETMLQYGTVTDGGRDEFRASQSIGSSWNTGRVLIAYDYLDQSELLTAEREFTESAPDPTALYPSQTRHSIFLTASQDLTSWAKLSGTATFSRRDNEFSQSAGPGIPPSIFDGQSEQINVIGGLNVDLGGSWIGDISTSYSRIDRDTITDNTAASIVTDAQQEVELLVINASLSGTLFTLPGGDVKAAIGGQYRDDEFKQNTITTASGFTLPPFERDLSRDVYAVFGELNVPLISPQNDHFLARRLAASIAVRHEDYSDFGSSTDPKFGLLYEPFEGVTIRGSYGTSFRAPRLLELVDSGVSAFSANLPFIPDPLSPTGFSPSIILNGTNPDLGPETSTSWTTGIDFQPAALPAFSASVTYFDIEFEDRIAAPASGAELLQIFSDPRFAPFVTRNPDIEAVNSIFALPLFFNNGLLNPEDVVLIGDNRFQNVNATDVNGLDFTASYRLESDLGSFSFQSAGSYYFEFANQLTPTSLPNDVVDTVFNPVDLTMRNSIAWSKDKWGASFAWNYVDGYTNSVTAPEERIDAWSTFDLQISYRFGENDTRSLLQNTDLRLNVQNLFDEDPPMVNTGNPDFPFDSTNSNPLGRFISFQVTKAW